MQMTIVFLNYKSRQQCCNCVTTARITQNVVLTFTNVVLSVHSREMFLQHHWYTLQERLNVLKCYHVKIQKIGFVIKRQIYKIRFVLFDNMNVISF